jgi:hypothetical protein
MAVEREKEMSCMQTYFDWLIQYKKRKLGQRNPHWVKRITKKKKEKKGGKETNRNIYTFFSTQLISIYNKNIKRKTFNINKSNEFHWFVD